ncbi:MAG: Indolepyruvate oxidoreductase subunit IorA [Pseudolabrys sp.]|jgi:indolepyruvate ferredoxin oxidoreductase alpha subunit|nr:Indolepyruvate oxidoreductase subunit IorA [Pseudolabrys sp.]
MERSFKTEVQSLALGDGDIFRGEGILAVTKALLQSGVSYIGGYQGAPVSHLLDVMVDAEDQMRALGVHVETCTNEASAAAMLGASINYPLRGAVTWKSIVGTNVAADALSNLASPGVIGGALIIIGEDYGEGASVIQERTYAYAMKSSLWLLDPRPDLPAIVRTVETGFELSEASHTPVMLELRIRACHVTGEFAAKDNRKGEYSGVNRIAAPARFNYGRLAHPPVTYAQEKLKIEERLPAARAFIREHKLNELVPGDLAGIGIVVMGGLTNSVLRGLERLGLADGFGASRVPLLVLNVVYPLVPDEIRAFCAGKTAVLVVEEGYPDYIEQAINVELRRADIQTRVLGKGVLPRAGEYASDVLLKGLAEFLREAKPAGIDAEAIVAKADALVAHKAAAAASLPALPPRPPTFCTGCPERPVFSALKLMQRELGPAHISADIGCHSFATFAPFSMGNSILGYGMSLASAAGVTPNLEKRPIAIMGDGGFWHNGVITGVASNLFNKGDGVLIVMQNGYTSATGQQFMPSSKAGRDGAAPGMDIETTLRALGVKWMRKVRTYGVATMVKTLKEAMRSAERGLKVIIADGECQLARQRRVRAEDAEKLKRGKRVTRARYGVDDEICTGDHSCIRLSGCPSLTVKPSPDPLRTDPVATVIESCVGCGLCGEVAHAAVLCPSFYRAEIVRNPTAWDRFKFGWRATVIGWLGGSLGGAASGSPSLRGARETSESGIRKQTPNEPPDSRGGAARGPGTTAEAQPLKILIAALGGEGGGVLTDWLVRAATHAGFPVQSTSIPGVAQRTGATTYYIEILPRPVSDLQGKRPVLALTPGIGDIDIVVASELLEAGRTVANGYVTPGRTSVIASISRFYAMDEKTAMGDGRLDSEALRKAIAGNARDALLTDLAALAKQSGAMINAVMLGAIAGSGRLPIAAEMFEAAIREDGKAVEGNLRGFRAGLDAARAAAAPEAAPTRTRAANAVTALEDIVARTFPAAAQPIAVEGVRRLAAYQNAEYARLYLDRLQPILKADEASNAGGRLAAETARHLAVRMSYEDVIRVAAAKIAPERLARIAGEELHANGAPFSVHDFLKPGFEELCQVLPGAVARPILRFAERKGWLGRVYFGMEINTTSVAGYLTFLALAKLKPLRPYGHRYPIEQAQIENWLALIVAAARLSPSIALEVTECARLIKGYGDTHARGSANYRAIVARVIQPLLGGQIAAERGADAIASARTSALVDPEGESLARCIATIGGQSELHIAAE